MSTVVIKFDDSEAYEKNNDSVNRILSNAGVDGSECQVSDVVPPVYEITSDYKELDPQTLNYLRALQGVQVSKEDE